MTSACLSSLVLTFEDYSWRIKNRLASLRVVSDSGERESEGERERERERERESEGERGTNLNSWWGGPKKFGSEVAHRRFGSEPCRAPLTSVCVGGPQKVWLQTAKGSDPNFLETHKLSVCAEVGTRSSPGPGPSGWLDLGLVSPVGPRRPGGFFVCS